MLHKTEQAVWTCLVGCNFDEKYKQKLKKKFDTQYWASTNRAGNQTSPMHRVVKLIQFSNIGTLLGVQKAADKLFYDIPN